MPNATAVLVLGPVLVPVASELKLDAEPLLVLVALAAISSGLLTMVGDPATYLVSRAAGLGFTATLALAERFGLGSVSQVLRDIDWSTLIFFACTFILTGALESTGAIAAVAGLLAASAVAHPEAAVLLLLCGTAVLPR